MSPSRQPQHTSAGVAFLSVPAEAGIIAGIKITRGAPPLAGHEREKVTEGLDGLRERLTEYASMGARSAKWRADPVHGASSAKVSATRKVVAFYTNTDNADPGDPVSHDNEDCPHGVEIKSHHNDRPGTDHRRQCDWCAHHAEPLAVKR